MPSTDGIQHFEPQGPLLGQFHRSDPAVDHDRERPAAAIQEILDVGAAG